MDKSNGMLNSTGISEDLLAIGKEIKSGALDTWQSATTWEGDSKCPQK